MCIFFSALSHPFTTILRYFKQHYYLQSYLCYPLIEKNYHENVHVPLPLIISLETARKMPLAIQNLFSVKNHKHYPSIVSEPNILQKFTPQKAFIYNLQYLTDT